MVVRTKFYGYKSTTIHDFMLGQNARKRKTFIVNLLSRATKPKAYFFLGFAR